MINRDELIKIVAERCGISPEVSSYFIEVFINRLSSRLKPGEASQFFNYGYFQKRNCRIQVEKSPEKPAGGSLLVPLILFSAKAEIAIDPKDFYFFRIPDLKTLWENDEDFQESLKSGGFAPHQNRSQLINSFATKAEVIISQMVKHHTTFEEELIIPSSFNLTLKETPESKLLFDTNPSVTAGTVSSTDSSLNKAQDDKTSADKKEAEDTTLPWSFGKKFYDKKVDQFTPIDFKHKDKPDTDKESIPSTRTLNKGDDSSKKIDAEEALDAAIEESDLDKNITKFREFEPVKSRLSGDERGKLNSEEQNRLRSVQKKITIPPVSPLKTSPKFTEVKSKTEAYHLQGDVKKLKKKKKLSEVKNSQTPDDDFRTRRYTGNRNILPIVMIISVSLIAIAVVYIYFIKGDSQDRITEPIFVDVNPPPDVNVIERDYEYAVTYPYPKVEQEIPIEGINPEVFSTEQKTEKKPSEKKVEPVEEKPKEEKPVEIKKEEVTKKEPEVKVEKVSRIFLYNNYYIVYVGSYSSYAVADREAEKYFNEGYNAFVEVEEIPGKPTRYKLNVGDFTSEQFAKEFESKYLK